MSDEQKYDSTQDTWEHISLVRSELRRVRRNLEFRARNHDQSKLTEPEKTIFDEYTPLLKELTYGSDEYKRALAGMQAALEHHYAHNSHHPEYYTNGISGMSLLDLLEMVCDWKAASERHADGDIRESLRINIDRFGIDAQLACVLRNTIEELYP